jgi:dihydroneopterin aldolase/2-amino-4-hydroxy-6-hydroxymethyldihydropteridine diphosphokinase
MTKDKIIIKDFEVFANHGLYPEEKALGQLFVVSAQITLDGKEAALSDDATKTIHYGHLCRDIEQLMREKPFNLIETVAFRLIKMIFEKYAPAVAVKLTVKKPWAPVAKHLSYVAVEMERTREEMKEFEG